MDYTYPTDLVQATKGVSHLHDAIETMFQRVKDYLERISIHLKPTIPPSPALLGILVDTLVHIFTVLALTTKYCRSIAENESKVKNVLRQASRHMRMFKCFCSSHHNAHGMPEGDYFRVLVDKSGAQEVLDKLDALMKSEQLVTAASAYASIREVELFSNTVQPQIEYVRDETGKVCLIHHVVRHLHLTICSSHQRNPVVAFSARADTPKL